MEVEAGVINSGEDDDIGGSGGLLSRPSGDGTVLYGACLPTADREAYTGRMITSYRFACETLTRSNRGVIR